MRIARKKELINAIFEGRSIVFYKNTEKKLQWDIVENYYNYPRSSTSGIFHNVYNWDTKKQVNNEAVKRILEEADYLQVSE